VGGSDVAVGASGDAVCCTGDVGGASVGGQSVGCGVAVGVFRCVSICPAGGAAVAIGMRVRQMPTTSPANAMLLMMRCNLLLLVVAPSPGQHTFWRSPSACAVRRNVDHCRTLVVRRLRLGAHAGACSSEPTAPTG
jgi:hypothetical protein